ncbi:hypothetical protein LCGC14_1657600 [marine sediment metagenome]|uniref:Uncharacterized protein n=1 Tax=marine sediment metagenome TaxID=412755 RepID=A0A0F9HV17_9ZZZZ
MATENQFDKALDKGLVDTSVEQCGLCQRFVGEVCEGRCPLYDGSSCCREWEQAIVAILAEENWQTICRHIDKLIAKLESLL